MANNFWVAALVTPLLISEDGRNPEMSRWCYDNPSAYMRYLNYLQSSKLDWPVKTSGLKATAPSLLSLCFEAYRKKELHDTWHAITLQQQAKGGLVDFNTPEREAVLDILTWTEDEMRERLHLNTRAK